MMKEVLIPDIGDVDEVDVIEMAVAEGDVVEVDQALLTLESDKATMDVPAPFAGTVKEIKVTIGDKVSQGSLVAYIDSVDEQVVSDNNSEPAAEPPQPVGQVPEVNITTEVDIVVPDIGDVDEVTVIELPITVGDELDVEQTVAVLESEKASMDIPATVGGKVLAIYVNNGDSVKQGDKIAKVASIGISTEAVSEAAPAQPAETSVASTPAAVTAAPEQRSAPVPDYPVSGSPKSDGVIHATPAVRRFARELGADLSKIKGTGRKNRILKADVQSFIKYELSRPKVTATTGAALTPEMPSIDFSKFGEIEELPLTRIQKVSSVALHRNWVVIPHVTQHHEVDITNLEEFRKSMKSEGERLGVRITTLGFMMKAVVKALQEFPKFNASLSADGETVILKKYFHVGVAVETPDGLVVPVIRDVDKKSVVELAQELGNLSLAARDKKLKADDMKGSCFTISSLGGIGGTSFTPIVNWPDVAILGVSRHQTKPVWDGQNFQPRLMLPLSLSYDHRVIDGADAARFIVYLGQILEDIRRIIM